MKPNHFLELARQASEKSDHHSHKLGCVIAKGSKVLGVGFNVLKTHPKSPHPFKSIHAEFMAAIKADMQIKGATVYVFRQQKNGSWATAKPCASCFEFLMNCGVKEVVYSYEGHFKKERVA